VKMWFTTRRRAIRAGLAISLSAHTLDLPHHSLGQMNGASATSAGLQPDPANVVDANDPVHGIRCDGVTDDAPAWNRLLVSLSGSGAVIRFTGVSVLSGPIHWRTKVSLQGAGWGVSVLRPVDPTGARYFPAIQATYGNVDLTLDDCSFSDFEVDGSGLTGTAAVISAKAIWIQFGRRHLYERLFLHDTIATALGSDFIPNSQIRDCRIERAGRNWTGHEGGHAGIGIGMGAWEEEPLDISSNTVVASGHWGIFVEWQVGRPYRSRGARIHGNLVTDTAGTGIADVGCTGTEIIGNVVLRSGQARTAYAWSGIESSNGASETMIRGNRVMSGAGEGVLVGNEPGDDVKVVLNQVGFNLRSGISIDPGAGAVARVLVEGNDISGNEGSGIEARSYGAGRLHNVKIVGNSVTGNGAPESRRSAGLLVDGVVSRMLVKANRFRPSRTRNYQQVAIAFEDGRLSSVGVTDNRFGESGRSAVIRKAKEIDVKFAQNHGYRTSHTGTASVSAGRRKVRVAHGLDVAPRLVDIDPKVFGESAEVARIGRTHFVVARRRRSPHTLRFRWSAVG
jgi:hypothetical protein